LHESAYSKFEMETAELKAKIADQQWKLNKAIVNATREEQKLLERAKQAETRLASIEADLAEGRVSATRVIAPISTLRLAEAQFEALAAEVSGFVARVMCEVGASTLDRAIGHSAVPEGKVQ
jgi:predicted  nucleic acid-binding Zn-ribbon protein